MALNKIKIIPPNDKATFTIIVDGKIKTPAVVISPTKMRLTMKLTTNLLINRSRVMTIPTTGKIKIINFEYIAKFSQENLRPDNWQ
ncbi:hypothetical protein XA3_03390 [Xylocopilactobacillus apicola]|uniref:Uncharacterized protein n=1 Tax=Xylocopilactobacillus apicola TaxID=2932184 RepID=A0AAU9D377_9LACO|nr:hypothetical protein XA3_03390 [Xylocopilactobacillus apicola]